MAGGPEDVPLCLGRDPEVTSNPPAAVVLGPCSSAMAGRLTPRRPGGAGFQRAAKMSTTISRISVTAPFIGAARHCRSRRSAALVAKVARHSVALGAGPFLPAPHRRQDGVLRPMPRWSTPAMRQRAAPWKERLVSDTQPRVSSDSLLKPGAVVLKRR